MCPTPGALLYYIILIVFYYYPIRLRRPLLLSVPSCQNRQLSASKQHSPSRIRSNQTTKLGIRRTDFPQKLPANGRGRGCANHLRLDGKYRVVFQVMTGGCPVRCAHRKQFFQGGVSVYFDFGSCCLQASLTEGCRLPVRMTGTNDWPLAEIISIKEATDKSVWYYVHYVDCKYRGS